MERMTSTLAPENQIALFSEDGQQWLSPQKRPLTWDRGEAVTKIVIGTPPTDGDKQEIEVPIPDDLARLYPNLTHLHLWQISNLERLPELPANLKRLDVRGCRGLKSVGTLANSLETLVLDGCGGASSPGGTDFPHLIELAIRACHGVSEQWLSEVLKRSPNLRFLDASDCVQLTRIAEWPRELVDVRLDGCNRLRKLPPRWPEHLRRIGLRRAEQVAHLPDFTPTLDYIDLAFTRSLRKLPRERGTPRTLYLFGSGIQEPPATEHGEAADDNVAADTAAYFADRELFGDGTVKRCKVLVLGNGGAGKTSLALALTGRDPALAKQLGTTHGVQFWDRNIDAELPEFIERVHLHFWDFGGQEIYHNTHRLFMSKGTVFLLLWDPAQDGRQPVCDHGSYQDEWRPLRYWLDFIHLACPHKPHIAVVCSFHTEETPELKARLDEQIPEELRGDCRCYFIDSLARTGQIGDLESWLQTSVGDVVAAQGTAVPSYWAVAQEMVEGWLQRMKTDAHFAAEYNQLHPDRFRDELKQKLRDAGESSNPKLREAIRSGTLELTDDRLRRTLSFLSRSGWVYWDRNLFEGRVIVGQKWALDGLYTILDRRNRARADTFIFRELCRSDGRFTLSDLGRLAWDEMGFGPDEQRLLLSYMQQCGLCFKLRRGEDAWREEDVYVSFEHLPTSREIQLSRAFDRRRASLDSVSETIQSRRLHKQHWQDFLTAAGQEFGKNAEYAIDGLMTGNEEGQLILVTCTIDRGGLGGIIDIEIAGPGAQDRLKEVSGLVRRFLPETDDAPRDGKVMESAMGPAAEHLEVFISYAWEPPQREGETGIPAGYEEPVDEIERFLSSSPYEVAHGEKRTWVKLLRDRNEIRFGDSLKTFMEYGARRPHVIVVHSDKFWRSPNCIFEMHCLWSEAANAREKSIADVLIPIDHIGSQIDDATSRDRFLEFWRQYSGPVPSRCWANLDELRDTAPNVIRAFSRAVSDMLDLHIRWSRGKDAVLAAVAQRLNLPAPGWLEDA
jgi:hypothetical protein